MGRVNDTISNVNAAVRNLLLTVLVGGAGFGGYKAYELYNEPQLKLAEKEVELRNTAADLKKANDRLADKDKQIASLSAANAQKDAQIDRLEVARKLLRVRHRLARVKVLDQHEVPALDPATPSEGKENPASRANVATKLEVVEVDEQGEPIGEAKKFEIAGDMVYVDFLHVTFDDKYIEQADMDRSSSLVLFQRIFGEHQEPAQGFQLDTVGTRPTAYGRGTKMSEFEKSIWNDFWLIANDPQKAKALGIHAAHGAAVAMRVQKDKTYEIDLRSTGEITFRPIETPAAAEKSPVPEKPEAPPAQNSEKK